MKNLILIILAFIISSNVCLANGISYKLTATNLNFTSPNTLEFDIYLLNNGTGKDEFRYSFGQYFFEFNTNIANNGKLTYSIAGSDLPESMLPRGASIDGNILRLAVNSIHPNKETLPVVTNQKPGVLIVRMKLETSADKFSNEQLNLKWTDTQAQWKTKLFAYSGKVSFEITNAENHISELDNSDIGASQNLTELPSEYSLSQNYPNPFNPETKINYELPYNNLVTLKIYDVTGKEIATLVNELQNAGRYEVIFNGSKFASGVYFYKIQAGSFFQVRKLFLIK